MLDRKIEEAGLSVIITLYGDVTVQNAAELKDILIEQLAAHSDLTVNLSYVTNCDVSMFQLICAAHKKALKDAKAVRVGDCSDTVNKTASSSGFPRTSGCVAEEHQGQRCLWQCEDDGVEHG